MKAIQKLIHAGFAACALASASLPGLSWSVWPVVDFEWTADVGKQPETYDRQRDANPTASDAVSNDSTRR